MKEKNSVVFVLEILGVFLLLFGVIFFVYNKYKQEIIKNDKQELKEVIDDTNIEETIKNKVKILLGYYPYGNELDKYSYNDYLIELFQNSTLNEESLTFHLLNYIEHTKGTDLKFDGTKITVDNKEFIVNHESNGVIHKDDYLNSYYYLFGNKNAPLPMLINRCPSYYYDKGNEIYISQYDCGEVNVEQIITYINRIDITDDYIYVYINIGYDTFDYTELDNDGLPKNRVIYSDINKEQANVIKKIGLYDHSYIIDQNNYSYFSEYKITFKKVSEDYYYDIIEKIK